MVRIAKPGALIYNGWNGYFYTYHGGQISDPPYVPPIHFIECFAGSPHTVDVVQDSLYLGASHGFFGGKNCSVTGCGGKMTAQMGMRWAGTFGVVIRKAIGA